MVRAWLTAAINRLRAAPDADVRFGERVRRMRGLAARNRDPQARRLVGCRTRQVGLPRAKSMGRVTLIVSEGHSLMRRPRGRGPCDVACVDRKARRYHTALFGQSRDDRFLK